MGANFRRVRANGYLRSTEDYLSPEGVACSVRVYPGEIILSIAATVGKVAIVDMDACIHDGFVTFKNLSEHVDTHFLYYWFQLQEISLTNVGQHGTQKNINSEIVGLMSIALPPLDEQRRIAVILRDADESIVSVEATIRAAQEVKRGVIESLYSSLENFEAKFLSELVDPQRPIVYGILMPGKGYENGIPVIKVKDLVNGDIQTDDLLLTSPEIDAQFPRSKLKTGDLLFSIRGTVGRMAFVPSQLDGANITQDTARISVKHADPIFVRNYLETRTIREYCDLHTIGQAVRGINLADVRRIRLHIPPMDEQRQIAELLQSQDEAIRAMQVEADRLREVKRG